MPKTSNLHDAGMIGGRGKKVEDVISIEKIVRAVSVFGSVEAAAPRLGVSRMAIFRALDRTGNTDIQTIPGRGLPVDGSHKSRVADWIRSHQGRSIPRSVKALAESAGVTMDAAKSYLKRRRRVVRDHLETLPDLRQMRIPLLNIDGVVRDSDLFKSYVYKVDRYAMSCRIDATLKNGASEVFLIPDLNAFVKNVKGAVKSTA